MSFSGKAIHHVYSSQGQEAFFAGHVAAFTELGGVPAGEIRYDNLSSAVRRVGTVALRPSVGFLVALASSRCRAVAE